MAVDIVTSRSFCAIKQLKEGTRRVLDEKNKVKKINTHKWLGN